MHVLACGPVYSAYSSRQDILRRHQAEGKAVKEQGLFQGPVDWTATSNLELTPSESLFTSDTVSPCSLQPREPEPPWLPGLCVSVAQLDVVVFMYLNPSLMPLAEWRVSGCL